MKPCPECNGTGLQPERDNEGNETGRDVICSRCGGSGEAQEDQDDPPTKWTAQRN
jgi:DnaJ-class molecular chaperone